MSAKDTSASVQPVSAIVLRESGLTLYEIARALGGMNVQVYHLDGGDPHVVVIVLGSEVVIEHVVDRLNERLCAHLTVREVQIV